MESGIDSRREKLSGSKDPKRCVPRRCSITITIYNCDDATQPHTQEMHSRKSQEKMNYLMYMDDIKLLAKNERELDGMELPNQDKIRRLGENETYKYLGILEADTIKHEEMKEKIRKNISGVPKSYSRQNYIAETLPK